MLGVVPVAPSDHANLERGQEIRVSGGNSESTARIFGTDIVRVLINGDAGWSDNKQSH